MAWSDRQKVWLLRESHPEFRIPSKQLSVISPARNHATKSQRYNKNNARTTRPTTNRVRGRHMCLVATATDLHDKEQEHLRSSPSAAIDTIGRSDGRRALTMT
mmetsp:Transcript_1602/g.3946  ORF Transcript_1602/g.3946 Transcript_1602/m.3946 type:complete len:103 (+) Transcript_1602:1238-1546(+)